MESKPARWNIVSVLLPLGALVLGLLAMFGGGGTRDHAGLMGSGAIVVMLAGGACVFGVIASIVALIRGERHHWLSLLGLIGNGAIILPLAELLLRG